MPGGLTLNLDRTRRHRQPVRFDQIGDPLQDPLQDTQQDPLMDGLGGLQGLGLHGAFGDTTDEGESYKSSIERSQQVFSQEDRTLEGTRDRRRRHRHNRDLKRQKESEALELLPEGLEDREREQVYNGLLRRKMKEYRDEKRLDPDKARIRDNHAMKERIDRQYEEGDVDTTSLEGRLPEEHGLDLQKLTPEQHYRLEKTHSPDTTGQQDKISEVRELQRKQRNQDRWQLLKDLHIPEGTTGLKRSWKKSKLDKEYQQIKELSPEALEQKEKLEAEQSHDESEKRRKKDNARLKKEALKISDLFGTGNKSQRRKEGLELYHDNKRLSPTEAKKKLKEREKRSVREYNDQLMLELRDDPRSEDPGWLKQEFVKRRGVTGEKDRKARNKELKKRVSKDEYRRLKVHPENGSQQESTFETQEKIKLLDTLGSVGGGVSVGVGAGTRALSGDTDKINKISGTTSPIEHRGGKDEVVHGGTTAQTAGILTGVSGLAQTAAAAMGLVEAVNMRGSDDPVQREAAKRGVVDGLIGTASGLATTTGGVLAAIQGFATDPALATLMKYDAIPVVGAVGSLIKLVNSAVELGEAAHRARKVVGIRNKAKEDEDHVMTATLTNVRNADLELVASSTMSIVEASVGIASAACTASVVAAPIGAALKGVQGALGGLQTLGTTVLELVKAGKINRVHKKWDRSVEQGDDEGMKHYGRKLLKTDSKFAVQGIINEARDGNPRALEYLDLFGMGNKDLSKTPDSVLRKLILRKLKTNEDPQTVYEKIAGIGRSVKGLGKTLHRIGK